MEAIVLITCILTSEFSLCESVHKENFLLFSFCDICMRLSSLEGDTNIFFVDIFQNKIIEILEI